MSDLHRLAACTGCGRQFDVSAAPGLARVGPGEVFACSCGASVTVPVGRPSDAAVVSCASCGAPRQGQATSCGFCGSDFTLRELDLDAICPRCLTRVSRGGRFCHHCALPITAPRDDGAATAHDCPACSAPAVRDGDGPGRPMASRRVAEGFELCFFECDRCAGIWLDKEVFAVLVRQAKSGRASLLGPEVGTAPPSGRPGGGLGDPIAYRPCAVCGKLMNRQNYGRRSGVLIDLCKDHGVWFDHDELRRVLDWVREGGATHGEVTEAVRLGERERARPVAVSPLFDTESRSAHRGGWAASGELIQLLVGLVDRVTDRWVR